MKSRLNLLLAAALAAGAAGAYAQSTQGQHDMAAMHGAAAMAMTSGEVRKIDADQGKLTLRHEAIGNLDMPPMTMVFRVEKPELLKDLKPGDKVQFRAESQSGALVVTHIQKAG